METQLIVTAGSRAAESMAFAGLLMDAYRAVIADLGIHHARVTVSAGPGGVHHTLHLPGDHCDRLAAEAGVHSLTRRSPHDPERRRHTSFARVSLGGGADNPPTPLAEEREGPDFGYRINDPVSEGASAESIDEATGFALSKAIRARLGLG